mgnify:CR=1 FL=1
MAMTMVVAVTAKAYLITNPAFTKYYKHFERSKINYDLGISPPHLAVRYL